MANSLVCNGVVGKCSEFHSHYIGKIDNKDSKFVAGWVRSKGDLPASLSVSLFIDGKRVQSDTCLLYTSPSPRDQRGSRMPSSA